VFVRVSPVVNLHVRGKIIGTTAEHPFWVRGKGWRAAAELRPGDELQTHAGGWVPVEGVADSGEVTTVHNFRVADHHTYFVGQREWGFDVWAHNADYSPVAPRQGDHVFNKGLGKGVGEIAEDLKALGAWDELAEALVAAKSKASSALFSLTVKKLETVAGGDANSRLFGEALQALRKAIGTFLEAATAPGGAGAQAARQAHSAQILEAWKRLIANAFDPDAAKLADPKLVRDGQTLLQELLESIGSIVSRG
jgi:hypothetical protein